MGQDIKNPAQAGLQMFSQISQPDPVQPLNPDSAQAGLQMFRECFQFGFLKSFHLLFDFLVLSLIFWISNGAGYEGFCSGGTPNVPRGSRHRDSRLRWRWHCRLGHGCHGYNIIVMYDGDGAFDCRSHGYYIIYYGDLSTEDVMGIKSSYRVPLMALHKG